MEQRPDRKVVGLEKSEERQRTESGETNNTLGVDFKWAGSVLEKSGEFGIGKGWGPRQPGMHLFGGTAGSRVSGGGWGEGRSKEREPEEGKTGSFNPMRKGERLTVLGLGDDLLG